MTAAAPRKWPPPVPPWPICPSPGCWAAIRSRSWTQTDVLCISGGVPLDNPLVVEAMQRGIPLTNDTQIFMEVAPCQTIGITGSAGKTTTTTLVGQMAKIAYWRQ